MVVNILEFRFRINSRHTQSILIVVLDLDLRFKKTTYQAEEEPANFALMAIPSSSSSDNELSLAKPAEDLSHTNRPSVPIIKKCVSDSEDDSETTAPQIPHSSVQSTKQETPPMHYVQPVEAPIPAITPKPTCPKTSCSGKKKNRKTCFVCRSRDHLIKDCKFHDKPQTKPSPRNYAHMGFYKQHASFSNKYPQKHIVLATVLLKSKPVSVTAVRPICADVPKIMMTRPRHAHSLNTRSNLTIRRHKTCSHSSNTSNSSLKVTTTKALVVSTAKEEEPANFALMAIPSSSSSDNELSPAKPTKDLSNTNRPSAPIKEEWVSDSEDDSETTAPQIAHSFVQGYNKQHASFTKKFPQKHIVPAATLPKSKPISVTAVRPICIDVPKIMMTKPRHAYYLNTRSNLTIRRHKTCSHSSNTSNSSPKVTVAKALMVSAAKVKKGKWVWRPKWPILDHDSRTTGVSMTLKRLYSMDAQGRLKLLHEYWAEGNTMEVDHAEEELIPVERLVATSSIVDGATPQGVEVINNANNGDNTNGINNELNEVRFDGCSCSICYEACTSGGKHQIWGCDKQLFPAYMLLSSWDEGLDVCVDLTGSSPLTQTGMVDCVPGRAVIDAAQRKRAKYMAKCAAIGYGFLPLSFSSLGELEADAVTLLKWI
nr:auxilin-like protein [Tanacetum cinerariifolium]